MDSEPGAKIEPCVSRGTHGIEVLIENGEEEERRDQDRDQEKDLDNPEVEWKIMMQQFLKCQQSTMELLTLQLQSKQENKWENRKFPVYKEGDDVNIFLTLFESVCKLNHVSEDHYIQILYSHVHGDLARLLQQLPYEEINDYQKFKKIALQYFVPTENQLCKECRNLHIKPGELHTAFMAKVIRAAESWLQAANVKTFEDLCNLIIREQFLKSIPQEMDAILQTKSSKDLMEMAALAEQISVSRQQEKPETYSVRRF